MLAGHTPAANIPIRSTVATDYDAPRTTDTEEHNLAALTAQRSEAAADPVQDGFDLPVGDLTGEDLPVRLVPRQADEFTCTACYLVHRRSQLADRQQTVCSDCAAETPKAPAAPKRSLIHHGRVERAQRAVLRQLLEPARQRGEAGGVGRCSQQERACGRGFLDGFWPSARRRRTLWAAFRGH